MIVIVKNAAGKSGVLVGRAVVKAAETGDKMKVGTSDCRAFLRMNGRIDVSYTIVRNKSSVTLWFNNDEGERYE